MSSIIEPQSLVCEPTSNTKISTETRESAPLGVTPCRGRVNFSIFSRHGSRVDLLLFDREDDAQPARVIRLDPFTNRTYFYWHTFVPELKVGQIYAYRVGGSFDPPNGLRFDSDKVLLDPYSKGVAVPRAYSGNAAARTGDNAATAMKSVVIDPAAYDWEEIQGWSIVKPSWQLLRFSFVFFESMSEIAIYRQRCWGVEPDDSDSYNSPHEAQWSDGSYGEAVQLLQSLVIVLATMACVAAALRIHL